MNRVIAPPTPRQLRADGTLPAGWWHTTENHRLVCDLCPRECHLKPGDRGFCFVRQNQDGEMVLTTYGRSTGFCIDPIEKKPLHHFYPGTSVLSFGTAGCNLGCKFCQNHDISKARQTELLSEHAMPETIAEAAEQLGCRSVAYTYNDPIIWAEYAIDTAKACRAVGIQSVAVTAGYISPEARGPFFEFFDAANVDLKAFSEDFYEKVTLSHLQPILDTLRWLKHETDVWFEVTNLLIPDANDSPDEIRQLCDWLLDNVGPEVPIHFSAFHPDFRMQDRERTSHESLLMAHEIARTTGLQYAYVGNVHDEVHQSTYCAHCQELVIQRDWYQLGTYHLEGNRCRHCGHTIPGRFADRPGNWGRKRQPIKISQFARDLQPSAKESSMPASHVTNGFSEQQQAALLKAACELVSHAVNHQPSALTELNLHGCGSRMVDGVYVSLKRAGHLRGCCGFTGRPVKLIDGLQTSALRTALEDPRFPPVSPSELPYLEVEIWLLGSQQLVSATGRARVDAIQVGRDGLLIQRDQQRGLLLPGVATDRDWDEETFLRQVCIKAGLPPSAWQESDTILHRFEGQVVRGNFDPTVASSGPFASVVTADSLTQLAHFCQNNVQLLQSGALPNYYLPDVTDGMVAGVVLQATLPSGQQIWVNRLSLRPLMPLQATLFALCEGMVKTVNGAADLRQAKIDLAVLEDPALHGHTLNPDFRGLNEARGLMVRSSSESGIAINREWTADRKLQELQQHLQLRPDRVASLSSFHVSSTAPMLQVNGVRTTHVGETRPAAVAGRFYPGTPAALGAMVRKLVPSPAPTQSKWRAAMIPHAGLPYSGAIAAETLAHLEIPPTVIILGPKHTRHGVDWAVAPHRVWSLPGMEVNSNPPLAQKLADTIDYLQLDSAAHQAEHCIEVELPLLHHYAPNSSVVGIAIGSGDLSACHQFATGLAQVLGEVNDDVLVLISSDMNHFASDEATRRLDEMALQAIETLDVRQLYHTVRDNEISMCGLLPAVITLDALQQLAPLTTVQRVRYGTSADVTGDTSRVVGYAGLLFR